MDFGTVALIACLGSCLKLASSEVYHPEEPPSQAGITYPKCEATPTDPDADCIFGTAGSDYPIFSKIPDTGFPCLDHIPGIYGDTEAFCQVYHMCLHDGTKYSFLCPNGTVFNQAYFVCDLWINVDCSRTVQFYSLNENIYKNPNKNDNDGSNVYR